MRVPLSWLRDYVDLPPNETAREVAARLIRAAAARMLADIESGGAGWQQDARDIVVIGSNVGRHISPFSSMYGATKFAVNSLAEAQRRELGPKGIRVTLIEPGFVRSEFQEVAGYDPDWFDGIVDRVGPVLSAEDVAEAIYFLTSDMSAKSTGNIINVDAGNAQSFTR